MTNSQKLISNLKKIDMTAMRIFFSVVAILLSLTTTSRSAVQGNAVIDRDSFLEKNLAKMKMDQKSNYGKQENKSECLTEGSKQILNLNHRKNLLIDSQCTLPKKNSSQKES